MNVDIWSDIACPWCFIGKRRFEAALAGFEHGNTVRVTWHSFELDPNAPAERSGDRAANLAAKYATSTEQAQAMMDQMTATAAADGLAFRFDIARSGNTFDAHRLVHLAAEHDLQDAMKERLFAAYLEEGELMSDHETLARLAGEVGLAGDAVAEMLAGDRCAAGVREDEATAAALGITGVPFFVVDRAFAVPGAQSPEVLRGALQQAWAKRTPAERGDPIAPGAIGSPRSVDAARG